MGKRDRITSGLSYPGEANHRSEYSSIGHAGHGRVAEVHTLHVEAAAQEHSDRIPDKYVSRSLKRDETGLEGR